MQRLFFVYFLVVSVVPSWAQFWQSAPDFPGTERDDPTAFVIGSKAYCGSGQKPWYISSSDFYSFDMSSDTWDTIASLPASGRQYASAFAGNGKGYVFGGFDNAAYYGDLWEYDPTTDQWTSRASLPAMGRMGCASFVINDTAYIAGGRTSSALSIKEVWAYDMINDTWQRKNDLPFGARWRSASAEKNGKGYIMLGRDENNRFCEELYEYNAAADSWTLLSLFPDPAGGRTYSSLVAFSNDLFLIGGLDSLGANYSDLWRINPDTLVWQQLNSIPAQGRRGGSAFASATVIYYTTGVTQNGTRLKETWKVGNPTGIKEMGRNEIIPCYPNPAHELCFLSFTEINLPVVVEITDHSGRLLKTIKVKETPIRISTSDLSNGSYFIRIQSGNKLYHSKMMVVH